MKKMLCILCVCALFCLTACSQSINPIDSQSPSSSQQSTDNDQTKTSNSTNNDSSSVSVGATSSSTSTSQSTSVSDPNEAKISSVEANGHTVTVNLSQPFASFDANELTLKAYDSNFYSLSPSANRTLTVTNSEVGTNAQGNTKITYTVSEEITNGRIENYFSVKSYNETEKTTAINNAKYAVSWQLDNGGWDKSAVVSRMWNGTETKGPSGWTDKVNHKPMGTIDNSSTYTEMRTIALGYALTTDETEKALFKTSFANAMKFLDDLQYPSGGFAQVYPRRGNYSDYVTINDDAMPNVLMLLEDIKLKKYPFDSGIVSDSDYALSATMITSAIDYLLKAQITSEGVKTAWCAQHDPVDYSPKAAREYEPISISGSESIGVIKFLLNQNTPECKKAAEDAIKFFDTHKLENTAFNNKVAPYFTAKQGSTVWYRFYEIGTGKGIFSDRKSFTNNVPNTIIYDFAQVSQERREGYSWVSAWPQKIITVYNTYGYYSNKVMVSVKANSSKANNGNSLAVGSTATVAD